jgi:5-formyltetrahydrofolate cyclo-ligase
MTKETQRNFMKEKRMLLSEKDVKIKSRRIVQAIESLPFYGDLRVIGSYVSFNNEVDLSKLSHPSATFVYPRVEGKNLHFHVKGDMERSVYGVLEPKGGEAYDDQIDLLLVPALAISKARDRIGYGKAFYDRFLKRLRPLYVVGVIYDFQEVETIETHAHDERLDAYVKG